MTSPSDPFYLRYYEISWTIEYVANLQRGCNVCMILLRCKCLRLMIRTSTTVMTTNALRDYITLWASDSLAMLAVVRMFLV